MSQSSGITRRMLLRGAGAALALPFLEATLKPFARADAPAVAPPKRLGIVSTTGGTVLESWKPREIGRLGSRLPSILRPLEFAKDDILVLSGLSQNGRSENLNAHEHCSLMHLTGAPTVRRVSSRMYAGVSIDQAVARVLGEQSYLPSLEMGANNNQYSFRAADAPVPTEANPRLLFERMFRGRTPVVPNWQRRSAARAQETRTTARPDSFEMSVLDLVLDDARGLRNRLGQGDQRRLDEYLHAVRSVEQRTLRLEDRLLDERRDATNPGPSRLHMPTGLWPAGSQFHQYSRFIDSDSEKHAEYIALLADLMIIAFQTDTTRVATLAIGSDEALFPGVVTVGSEQHCHTLEHQGNAGRVEDADPIAREACRQIHAFYTVLFADLVRKMKAIDEGGSTLLDNSMIVYTSYMADGGHGTRDYPVLLAGRAGGIRPGRHLAYRPHTPVSNLYVEILNRFGIPTDEFGESATSEHAAYDGRLPGLDL